jgi:hypothetical protein
MGCCCRCYIRYHVLVLNFFLTQLFIPYTTKIYRAEVASLTGVLDEVDLGDDSKLYLKMAKNTFSNAVNGFRTQVKRRLNPEGIHETISSAMGKEKMATLGAAAGAFVGFLI